MKIWKFWRKLVHKHEPEVRTKRVRMTKSILLRGGGEALIGEVRDLPEQLANDLIFMDAAVACDDGVTHETELPPEQTAPMLKVKLLRSCNLGARGGSPGEVHEVPSGVAYSLITCGSAEPHGWVINPRDFSEY